jgi:hypothetical protein
MDFGQSKFICSRIKKRREPRVTVVTLKLCGDRKSLYSLYDRAKPFFFPKEAAFTELQRLQKGTWKLCVTLFAYSFWLAETLWSR